MPSPFIPSHTLKALRRYADQRLPPGDFVRSVLENNLKEAFQNADSENTEHMQGIVSYCYNHIPAISWGSPERVKAWLTGEDLRPEDHVEEGRGQEFTPQDAEFMRSIHDEG